MGTLTGATNTVLHGGAAGLPTFGAVVLTAGATQDVTGTLPVANGGTGDTALTTNGVLYGNGTSAAGITAAGVQYNVLVANATGVPTFGQVNLASAAAVTGILGVANGGTGISSGTTGGVLFYSAPGTIASSSALVANQLVLGGGATGPTTLGSLGSATTVLHGGAGAPSFSAVNLAAGGDVTGILPVANGGTGSFFLNRKCCFIRRHYSR